MSPVIHAAAEYERWLAKRLVLIPADVKLRREKMAGNAFAFLRGSFFRWVEVWPEACPDLADAPRVLGIGDVHVENFGTWRDADGRLAWGVNDFDEAAVLPYTNDLVRLCTSAVLAAERSPWQMSVRRMCAAVLEGYRESLVQAGAPVVLGQRHGWLRTLAESRLEEEPQYWAALTDLQRVRTPARLLRLLARAMPEPDLDLRVVRRRSGLGSLGRQRFTALATWRGGLVAREAKPLTGSTWHWRQSERSRDAIRYQDLSRHAVRAQDPSVNVQDGWVMRRLAPDCRKIEIEELSRKADLHKLLFMMGWELGNVHLATRRQRHALLRDLQRRQPGWLVSAVKKMAKATVKDWRAWRKDRGGSRRA